MLTRLHRWYAGITVDMMTPADAARAIEKLEQRRVGLRTAIQAAKAYRMALMDELRADVAAFHEHQQRVQ